MQWHDVTRKIFGGPLRGPGKILGGQWPPLAPPSSAPGLVPLRSCAPSRRHWSPTLLGLVLLRSQQNNLIWLLAMSCFESSESCCPHDSQKKKRVWKSMKILASKHCKDISLLENTLLRASNFVNRMYTEILAEKHAWKPCVEVDHGRSSLRCCKIRIFCGVQGH